jgi:hypothetical protein
VFARFNRGNMYENLSRDPVRCENYDYIAFRSLISRYPQRSAYTYVKPEYFIAIRIMLAPQFGAIWSPRVYCDIRNDMSVVATIEYIMLGDIWLESVKYCNKKMSHIMTYGKIFWFYIIFKFFQCRSSPVLHSSDESSSIAATFYVLRL